MKLKGKCIIFGLTSPFYAFYDTIKEMKNIVNEGGNIIPIMPIDTDYGYEMATDFVNKIENISKKKIITCLEEAKRQEGDILIIAPCSR